MAILDLFTSQRNPFKRSPGLFFWVLSPDWPNDWTLYNHQPTIISIFFWLFETLCVFDPTTGTIVPIFPRMAPSPAWPTHRVTGQELNAYLKALKPYYYFVELLGVRKLPSCLGVQRNMVLELNVTNESMINWCNSFTCIMNMEVS